MAENEGARKEGKFIVVNMPPDVCLTPPNPVPVPYQIVAYLDDSVNYSPNVNFNGNPAMHMKGRITQVTGNEAGSAGGVKSGVNKNYCRPITHSSTVRANGEFVIYHKDTLMWMNCAGPEGPGNTIGMLIFRGSSFSANTKPSDCDPCVCSETPQEENFLSKFGKRMLSPEGIVGMAQMAPKLANMDWSNPSAVLGSLGSVAGLGGLDKVAKAASLAGQAYNLSQADWDDLSTIFGAVGMAAGLSGMAGGMLGGQIGNTLGKMAGYTGKALNVAQTGFALTKTDWSNPGSVMGAASNLAGLGQLAGGNLGEGAQIAEKVLGTGSKVIGTLSK